jgi:hypothetical protein
MQSFKNSSWSYKIAPSKAESSSLKSARQMNVSQSVPFSSLSLWRDKINPSYLWYRSRAYWKGTRQHIPLIALVDRSLLVCAVGEGSRWFSFEMNIILPAFPGMNKTGLPAGFFKSKSDITLGVYRYILYREACGELPKNPMWCMCVAQV